MHVSPPAESGHGSVRRLAHLLLDCGDTADRIVDRAVSTGTGDLRSTVVRACMRELRRRRRAWFFGIGPAPGGSGGDAVSRLPSRQRAAMVLRFEGGCSLDEIAQVLGTSTSRARAELHRALLRVRSQTG